MCSGGYSPPTELALLNEARKLTETLIGAMHLQVRKYFGHKPCTHRKQASQATVSGRGQEEATTNQQDPQSDQATVWPSQAFSGQHRRPDKPCCKPSCGWALRVSEALDFTSELVRQQNILYHSDSRSSPGLIVNLYQAHIRPIVRSKARCNVEFGAKISISVTGKGFTFLDRLSFSPYNEGEDLKDR